MKWFSIVLCAVVSLLGVACSDGGADDGPDPGPTEDTTMDNPLADTQWHLVSIQLDGETFEFSGSAVPTLEFTEDRLMMSDGVNSARGRYSLDGDEFSAGPLASTLIGYPEPARPEFELIGLIDGASSVEVNGDELVIEVASGELTYQEGPPEPDLVELADTSWSLTDISTANESVNAALAPVPAVVTFGDGTVDAYDGVNTTTGTFEQDGTELSIELGAPSEIAVTGEVFPQYELFELLPLVDSAELIDETTLLLRFEEGSLRFESVGGGVSSG